MVRYLGDQATLAGGIVVEPGYPSTIPNQQFRLRPVAMHKTPLCLISKPKLATASERGHCLRLPRFIWSVELQLRSCYTILVLNEPIEALRIHIHFGCCLQVLFLQSTARY